MFEEGVGSSHERISCISKLKWNRTGLELFFFLFFLTSPRYHRFILPNRKTHDHIHKKQTLDAVSQSRPTTGPFQT